MSDLNTFDWLKKIAVFESPIIKQLNAMNAVNQSIYSKLLPNYEFLNKINKINLDNSIASQLTKINQTINPEYLNSFKKIESFYKNPLQDLANKLAFRTYDLANLIDDYEENAQEENITEDNQSVQNIFFNESRRIKEILFEIYLNNEKLYKISPREFEKIIAELLYHKGFEVELTKQTRDNGYDILALKYNDDLSPIKYLVECKRFSPKNKIGVGIVREFKEVIFTEQANKGLIVTTSYFSNDALKKQKETPYLLDYKDKDDLMDWVKNYYYQNR